MRRQRFSTTTSDSGGVRPLTRRLFHQSHQEQIIVVPTAGKEGYTATVQNIYGIPPPPPEEHHEAIEDIQTIVQVMQTHIYYLEVMAQANAVLTSSNSAVMSQLSQITVAMNAMQEKLKTLASAQTKQTRPKRNHYFWSFGRN